MRQKTIEPAARQEGGFSLIELLVSLAIMIVVIIGMLGLFDRSNRMTKTENSVTDAQQSARYGSYQVVRESRMSGAGGLPASTNIGAVHQLSVSLNLGSSNWATAAKFQSNNVNAVTDNLCIGGACGASGAHHVRVGTDMLHIRGVITNALYDIGLGGWTPPASGNSTGTLIIRPCTKFSDILAVAPCAPFGANDMTAYPVGGPYPVGSLFAMTDSLGNVGVGRITAVTAVAGGSGVTATLTIDVGLNSTPNTTYTQTLCPNGVFPPGLTNPSRGGILDDRVYFIDDGPNTATNCNGATTGVPATSRAVQDQNPGPCHPALAYADWVYAAGETSTQAFTAANVTQIADDIEDLQVAYGVDFYDTSTGAGTFLSPAPQRNSTLTGAANAYSSDGSISRTTKTGTGGFDTIITAARGSTAPNLDPSEDTSAADKDEWIFNVAGEPGTGTFRYDSDLSLLKAIEIAILAKGSVPDPFGRSPNSTSTVNVPAWAGAFAWPLMDSLASTVSQPTSGAAFPYHRRLNTVRVNFRNFAIQ